MTQAISVSLIIISRDRPELLRRCLLAIRQQAQIAFELIVVSNGDAPQIEGLIFRHVVFAQANVAASRNAGIAVSSGEVVAFCDDDAVAEPLWLHRLAAPFAEARVGAAGGLVLGRNGVSLQWNAPDIDEAANEYEAVRSAGVQPDVESRTMVTLGTNCAFRRKALVDLGGFDVAFRYFLDEADVNWRLKLAGWRTAFVPDALVHHGFARNQVRNANRAPVDLFDIAASRTVFLRKHCPDQISQELGLFRKERGARAIAAFELGMIQPNDIKMLKRSMESGIADGMARAIGAVQTFEGVTTVPAIMPERHLEMIVLCGGPLQLRRLKKTARELVAAGKNVSVFCFWLNALALNVQFDNGGYWYHHGGVYGRALRDEPLFQLRSRYSRITQEIARIAVQRQFDIIAWPRRIWRRTPVYAGLPGYEVHKASLPKGSSAGETVPNVTSASQFRR